MGEICNLRREKVILLACVKRITAKDTYIEKKSASSLAAHVNVIVTMHISEASTIGVQYVDANSFYAAKVLSHYRFLAVHCADPN